MSTTREIYNGKVIETVTKTTNDETTVSTRTLMTNKDNLILFTFNWIGGGFNDVYAKNEAEVEAEAAKITTSLKVDVSTIKSNTASDWQGWCRMADRMCN